MDRIALISDIHGNMAALDAVLADIRSRGIDRIFCLGDLAGKGPCTEMAVDIIKESCEVVLQGNWDYLISNVHNNYFLKWHYSKLREEQAEYLKHLPVFEEFYMSGKLIRLCHASPKDVFHRVMFHAAIEEKLKLFEAPTDDRKECDMLIYGDLHDAFVENYKGKTLLNVGSVGNPLEIPQASYGIIEGEYGSLDNSSLSMSLVRVPYDIEKAVEQARESGMPDLDEYIDELRTARYRGLKKK